MRGHNICLNGGIRLSQNHPHYLTLSGALLKSLRVYWAVSLWHSRNLVSAFSIDELEMRKKHLSIFSLPVFIIIIS